MVLSLLVVFALLAAGGVQRASALDLPRRDGKAVVAEVNGEPILLDDLFDALDSVHADVEASGDGTMRRDPSGLLDRLINVRLIVQEARTIGLDELPEFRRSVDAYRVIVLRNLLFSDRIAQVAEADTTRVESTYRDAVEQVRLRSILIESEDEARRFARALKEGQDFDELVDALVSEGLASEGDSTRFMLMGALSDEVRKALRELEPGQVTPVIEVPEGRVVAKLIETRVPNDPEERAKAEREVLTQQRQATIRRYAAELKRKYVRIDDELLASIDVEADGPGVEDYLGDERVVARIKGARDVTVAELMQTLEGKYFHGTKRVVERGKLDEKMRQILHEILDRRVVVRESERLKLDATPEYRRQIDEFEAGQLFGAFVAKVIDPNLEVRDEDIDALYERTRADYTLPAMVRLESLAFLVRDDARRALEKLRNGADLSWLRDNATGQVPASAEGVWSFRGRLVLQSQLPRPVRDAVAGAEPGDLRLVEAGDEGPFYVLAVRERTPERIRPLEEVRDNLAEKVYPEMRRQAVEDYARRLRQASEVRVHARGEDLMAAILQARGESGGE